MVRKPDAETDDLRRERLQRDIDAGLRQIDDGGSGTRDVGGECRREAENVNVVDSSSSPFDAEAVERIKQRGRQLLKTPRG